MKKYLAGVAILFSLVIVPAFVSAAPSDIDPLSSTSACVSLNNNLRYQSRDGFTNGEVSTLQDFLQSQGYLNSEPTGYFGLLTLRAAKNFQSANGISPTGYVGPITRAKIKEVSCANTTTDISSQNGNNLPTVSLVANPISIISDGKPGTVILSWTSMDANSCSFEKQILSTSGSITVSLSQTATYTISCAGLGGTASSNPVTVTFRLTGQTPAPVPTVTLSANPTSIISDGKPGTVNLYWSSTNATSCGFEKQVLSTSGTMNVSLSQTATYTISCTGAGGSATSNPVTVTFQLTGQSTPPTASLSAYPTSIISDGKPGTITLSWSSTNANYCNFEKSILASSGSMTVSLSSTATYTISCTGAGGTTSSNPVTVPFQLTQQLPAVDLKVNSSDGPLAKTAGYSTFSWTSTNSDYCTASGDTYWSGTKSTSGSETVWTGNEKTGVTTYSITCGASSGKVNPASDSVTVSFLQSPTVDLKVNNSDGPLTKSAGYSTFSWTSANADYCTASGDTYWSGTKSTSGSESIWTGNEKTGMTTYQLTCGASSGKTNPANDSVTVNFSY